MNPAAPSNTPLPRRAQVLMPPRLPLPQRKRAERRAARARVALHVRQGLSPAQRATDPLLRARLPKVARVGRAVAAIAGSTALHVAVVVVGLVVGGEQVGRRDKLRQEARVEVRERKVEPPPRKEPEPPRPIERPEQVIPRVPRAEPPAPAPPPAVPVPRGPPPRVVGLSLESTVEGGSGPSFAVGNTRHGETAERAVTPTEVAPDFGAQPGAPAAETNKVAARLPVAGVKYALPKRKKPSQPPYPETLKSQGIEADVTVMVNLDVTGKVLTVKIIKEAPYPEFNEAARAAALAEDFDPATRDGVSIPYTLSFTYRFRLQDR